VLVASACGSSSGDPLGNAEATATTVSSVLPEAESGASSAVETPAGSSEALLASGTFEIPAVQTIADAPGFHERVVASGSVANVTATAGETLVIRLRDETRPGIECASEHPLSGCVTVDWSDFEDRPRVPTGGAFTHLVSIELQSGRHDFFLSESGLLADVPDEYQPG
jgi:hypothetical protein